MKKYEDDEEEKVRKEEPGAGSRPPVRCVGRRLHDPVIDFKDDDFAYWHVSVRGVPSLAIRRSIKYATETTRNSCCFNENRRLFLQDGSLIME